MKPRPEQRRPQGTQLAPHEGPSRCRRWSAAGLGLLLLLVAGPALAKKRPAPACRAGRFLVQGGERLLPAGLAPTIDAVVLHDGGAVSIASGCSAVRGKTKAKKRKVHLSARWPAGACTGVRGKVALRGQFDAACEVLRGTVGGKRLRRQRFTATRSVCGDGIVDADAAETCDLPSMPGSGEGVLLAGDPGAPALTALVHLAPLPALPADIADGLLLTRLDVAVAADATVGQVNAALVAVGGAIVAMKPAILAVTVAVPRQESADGLRDLAGRLAGLPGIRLVSLAREASPNLAPPSPADADAALQNLRDARFPAAWNAKALLTNCDKVTAVVADRFHRPVDPLYAEFATQVPGVSELGTGSVAAGDLHGLHGFDVLTTLAARLDSTVPTGADPFPECLDLRALQIAGLSAYGVVFAIDDALPATGKVVVNTSFGFNDTCDGPCTPEMITQNLPTAVERASWGAVQRAVLQPVENRVLVTSAAGNEADEQVGLLYPGAAVAGVGSSLNVAAKADSMMSFVTDASLWDPTSNCPPGPCFPSLTATPADRAALDVLLADLGQTSAPPLPNVVIVGSSDGASNKPSVFSDAGADVFAVGEDIPTLLGVPTRGTSFAAPQVAGLAAYLWLLSSDLRARAVADTIGAIEANARELPVHVIDAYATVLSLDAPVEPTPTSAPVRLAILNANDDIHGFDEADLALFHQAFRPGGAPIEPAIRDDSRFDLNGDGFTGGTRTARFDLDPTGSTRFGAPVLTQVTTEVGGEERTFDERAVTDADILCYYANTALYTGDPIARERTLFDLCSAGATFVGSIVVRTDVDSVVDEGCPSASACRTERGFEQESWTVRLSEQPDGSFEATGTVTQSLHDVQDFVTEEGEHCSTTRTEDGDGPVLSYGGRIADPLGVFEGTATVTETFENSPCRGRPGSMTTKVNDRSFFVGSDVVTPVFDGGVLVALVWDFTFDDGKGTVDTVRGRADIVR